MDDKIFCIDNPILPGFAPRTLILGSEAVLPDPDLTGSEPIALVETQNAGELPCAVGTLAFLMDGTIKWLTPSGWIDWA